MSLSSGSRLGPYEVVAPLGAGGMGEVYRARDSRLRRDVALKILPEDVAVDPARRARFEQEAHAAAALNHPNILSVFDVGADGAVSYIATELVHGETLTAMIARGPLPVRTLLDIAVQITDGLAAAHAAQIVHRDLKPANVMVATDGRVKILDFGLAKQGVAASGEETIAAHQTVPGMIVGTVNYMSPEQACGRAVDFRSDQFSFGLMLYEMAAGKRAFDEPESVQTLSAIISKDPPPLDAKVPAPLRWIIDRCLAKNPQSRYDSSRDLFQELRSVRDHLSEISTISPQAERAAVAAPAARGGTRWRALAAVFALGLLLPLVVALGTAPPGRPDPSNYRFIPFSFEPGGQTSQVFSGDGRALAYAARQTPGEPYQVYVRYLDSPSPRQLTELKESAYPLAWSPDNNRVLFATPAPAVWSIATAGGEPQLLTSLPRGAADFVPSAITVSNDNKVLAFLSRGDDGMLGVFTTLLSGGEFQRYAAEPYAARDVYNQPGLRWSPDGRQMLLMVNRGIEGEEGWLLRYPAEGTGGVRRLSQPLTTYEGTPTPAWMPDGRHVIVAMKIAPLGSRQLWMLDTLSQTRYALTSGTADIYGAAVARAGDRLAFREGAGNLDIVSVDLATGSATTTIATERNEEQPHWSSERSMVYTTDRNGPIEIWVRRDGVPDRPLVTAQDFSSMTPFFMLPTLSPRGERVVYARLESQGTTRLWISPVGGGAPIRATSENSVGTSEFPGAWSPDGTWLAYYAATGGKLDLMKVRTVGEAAPVLLKNDVPGDRLCDWSPAGEWIACGETLISPDGKTERSIGSHGSLYYAFSKDGRLLYGLRDDNGRQLLFSVEVATGAERIIGAANTFAPRASLSPAIRFSLAPDGRSLVYSAGAIRASLWLLEGFAPPDGILARLGWRR